MRIAVTADPYVPVPPLHYGGIERVLDFLVRGLVSRGHEVTLFAHRESKVPCRLVPYGEGVDTLASCISTIYQVSRLIVQERFDIVHSFGRLLNLLPVLPLPIAKIQSYQRHVTPRSIRLSTALANGSLTFTACSASCARTGQAVGGRWTVIPNGAPADVYTFAPTVSDDAPLVFLGRIERIKGAHTAIAVAHATGRRLILAGNHASEGPEWDYFVNEVAPRCDGRQVKYIGPVTDAQKNALLRQAAALLFPVEWEEPFGIVMVESLACGTPVLAFARGAVPEVVDNGETGYVCRSLDAMILAVSRLVDIERGHCRHVFEQRFSDHVIVDSYERLYASCLNGGRP